MAQSKGNSDNSNRAVSRSDCSLALTLMALLLLITDANSRSIRLEILPRDAVEQGHDATLRCHYDLDGKPLFALKWYRGEQEIYRYLPSLTPAIKIFNYTWIQIDPHTSTENQVVIRNVDFQLTGNFSCETTTDSESFYTQKSSKFLTVVCERHRDEAEPGEWSEISLQLQPFHYTKQGHLNLLCIAKIPNIYEQASEVLHLGTGVGDPVPERVTSEIASNDCHRIASLTIIVIIMLHLSLR
ncbi:uncharacterized protein LOC106643543 [Copidosoma floridanum]|uniref:uncharacterized protein LOC106643543 n=1 Tax=Copidosoma floridanum TaxID=29053 RepID=UPI000C6FAF5D|nr:uncharacterized protein LOC106643543 [Copidosoma floridanum]